MTAQTERALNRLAAVERSVKALEDEDPLDFADIFAASDPTPLREMAEAEMAAQHQPLKRLPSRLRRPERAPGEAQGR